ncbi:MAG TPA: hypothetical protein QGF58_19990 [Myxococcota bacterium]|nr:hypothetical protein [Myxococcota bacterium]
MQASERLSAAWGIYEDHGELGPAWVRAVCLLTRQALEQELRERVEVLVPGAGKGTVTLQLITLRVRGDGLGDAWSIAWTWNALSQACHHKGYELHPSAEQVRGWMNSVEAFLRAPTSSGTPCPSR